MSSAVYQQSVRKLAWRIDTSIRNTHSPTLNSTPVSAPASSHDETYSRSPCVGVQPPVGWTFTCICHRSFRSSSLTMSLPMTITLMAGSWAEAGAATSAAAVRAATTSSGVARRRRCGTVRLPWRGGFGISMMSQRSGRPLRNRDAASRGKRRGGRHWAGPSGLESRGWISRWPRPRADPWRRRRRPWRRRRHPWRRRHRRRRHPWRRRHRRLPCRRSSRCRR